MSTPWNPRSIIWLREATEAVPCPCCEDQTSEECPLCEGIGEVSPEMAIEFLADSPEDAEELDRVAQLLRTLPDGDYTASEFLDYMEDRD